MQRYSNVTRRVCEAIHKFSTEKEIHRPPNESCNRLISYLFITLQQPAFSCPSLAERLRLRPSPPRSHTSG